MIYIKNIQEFLIAILRGISKLFLTFVVNRFLVRFTLQVSALFAMIPFSIPITLHSPFCATIFYAIAMVREIFRAEHKKNKYLN